MLPIYIQCIKGHTCPRVDPLAVVILSILIEFEMNRTFRPDGTTFLLVAPFIVLLPNTGRQGTGTQPQRHHQRQQQTDHFFHHTFLSFPAKRVRFSPLKR